MPSKDYYAILGVSKTATADDIKKAFRRLAHEHHPDKGGDQQKFKDINEAYQIVGDADKRAKYDQYGSAAFDPNSGFGGFGGQGGAGGFGGFEGMNVNFEDFGDLGDILGGMFGMGGGGKGRGPKRGADIETEVVLDFLETVKGAKRVISLYKHVGCETCTGSGAEPGSKMETCKTCSGRGQVQHAQRTIFGTIQSAVVCPECHGKGQRPSEACKACKGAGVQRKTVEYPIDIPAGIADSEALRVPGEGEHPGLGGRPGDLFVRVRVKPHSVFERDGFDVRSTIRIPFSAISLGGDVVIDTVDGTGTLTIPESTQPGTVFQIRGKGFPHLRSSGRGDHLVTVQVEVKSKMTKEQKASLEELKKQGL